MSRELGAMKMEERVNNKEQISEGEGLKAERIEREGWRIWTKKLKYLSFSSVFQLLSSLLGALGFLLFFLLAWSGQVYGESDISSKVPDLCYKCHSKLKEGLSKNSVHFPFKQGKCLACHDSHVGNIKGLLKEDINTLCLNCHEGTKRALKKENVHGALKKGSCLDCHDAHSGDNKHLLSKPQKILCWNCHEPLKEQLKTGHVHAPFKEGQCSSCHDPHASSDENHLIASPNKICKSCHAPRCNASGISISSVTKELNCTGCHTGHSSSNKGLLGPYGHSAFLDKKCEECHKPITANKEITLKLAGKELCLSCHKGESTKFRDNDVHGKDKSGCAMCHNYHASKKKNLTVQESKSCLKCHEDTNKRIVAMTKALKNIRCAPVKDRKCFACHNPLHSSNPLYFKADKIATCGDCHKSQHEVSHPVGNDIIDPRNGQPVTCVTCHGMHSGKAEFMLQFDRKRQLCIQCHKK